MTSLFEDLQNNKVATEPGQFEIVYIAIDSKVGLFEITAMVKQINLYESIFKTFMTGALVIEDVNDTISQAAITGNEPVYIKFKTLGSDNAIDIKMLINGVMERQSTSDSGEVYSLTLISPEFLNNTRKKVSRSLNGSYSDMVKGVYNNYLSDGVPLWIEETSNNNRLIIPNTSPTEAIGMATQFAESSTGGTVNYQFFQTTKSFQFRSISAMVNNDEELVFRTDIEGNSSQSISFLDKVLRVSEFELLEDTDIIKHTKIGTFGSSLIEHDIRSKNWNTSKFNYHESGALSGLNANMVSPKGPVTENKEGISEFADSNVSMVSGASKFNYQYQQGVPQFTSIDYSSAIKRRQQVNAINFQRAQVSIPGISGLQAGDLITLDIPRRYSADNVVKNKNVKNEKLSGRWLIESLSHQVGEKYKCVLIVTRDSVPEAPTEYTELSYPNSTSKIIDSSKSNR